MRTWVLGTLIFLGVTFAVAALVIAVWIGISFWLGGNAEGAFGVSAFLAILFLPLLLAAPFAGAMAVVHFKRKLAAANAHRPDA